MDKNELEMLFKENAKLNSSEARTFHKQLEALQRRCDGAIKAMGLNDLDGLAKIQAEANAELRLFHKMQAEREHQPAEPVEAVWSIPYTESAEFMDQVQDIVQTENEIVEQLQELRSNLESETQARQESERINSRFQWANLILVALTLLATIVFGLHSCAAVLTSEAQEPEFAATDSMSAE